MSRNFLRRPSNSPASPPPRAFLPGERSIANSAGMLSFAQAQADWVRPGLLLYGVSPLAGSDRRGLWTCARDDAAIARDCGQGLGAGETRGLWRRLDCGASHTPGRGRGRLWRRLPAEPGQRHPGTGQRRACRSRGQGVHGHDRHRRHGSAPRRRSWAIPWFCGERDCRSRRSPYGRKPFPTSYCAASASGWRSPCAEFDRRGIALSAFEEPHLHARPAAPHRCRSGGGPAVRSARR